MNEYNKDSNSQNDLTVNQASSNSQNELNFRQETYSSQASNSTQYNNQEYNSNQAQNPSYRHGSIYSYGNTNSDNSADNNQFTVYPTPQFVPEKKPKRKRGFSKFIKFTAASVAFGLIAGAVTSGYHYLTKPKEEVLLEVEEETEKTPVNLAITETDKEEVSAIPTVTNADGIVSDVSDVVAKVMPSIVIINSSATITNYDIFSGRRFNEPVEGSGSGIIIGQSDTDLLIVTNNHVIADAESVEIVFSDESTADAAVKGADSRSDLAVLEVDLKDLSEETLKTIKVASLGNSTQVKPGEMAIAIGNALGYGQSVTVGYISAVNRDVEMDGMKMKLLQTDAAINPGNSGGALINVYGEVIGINSMKFASQEVEGMGYAIPISDAIPMINQLMNRETLEESEKGFLGINLETAQEITDVFSQQFNMPKGIYINDVVENSPAEDAGLRSGHIIVGLNGIVVETIKDLVNVLTYSKVGEEITLTIKALENGVYEEKSLTAILGERP